MTTMLERVRELFAAAVELPEAARRDFLRRECVDDDELRCRVAELLAAAPAGSFLEPPELEPLLQSRTPTRIGPYQVTGRCEGDDDAWAATDARGRCVRIEVHPLTGVSDEAVMQFVQKAYAAAGARLPRTAPVLEHGRTAAGLWIAMAPLAGPSLRTELERQLADGEAGPCALPARATGAFLPAVARFAQELATTLARAHAQGLAHGTVDPDRVRIDAGGGALLTGFGLAALRGGLALPAHDAAGLAAAIDALRALARGSSDLSAALADVAARARRAPPPALADLARELGDLAAGRLPPPPGGLWRRLKRPFGPG